MKLPSSYIGFLNQIDDGLFRGVITNITDIPGYVAFTFKSTILKKYEKPNEKDFKLFNIEVFDKKLQIYLPYEIYISSGTICGYSLVGNKKIEIDIDKINTSNFKKEFIGLSDYNRIQNLMSDGEKMVLNPSDVYSIFINKKEYFHIKDLEDGDFIGIDSEKIVYKITHDTHGVRTLNKTIEDVLTKE
ncbi:hypothetical protein QWY99_21335 [Flavobacterium branchiarum]|uniref:S1 motif domain-containing protein n=1 Tax=Flavobacterium branchiarum TaxID=1114870 RepID=A0ABV5FPN5_9FLAO|nr:hypothetical protein [Flavobacterium branchiarum]MDN3675579.1 hypothetical protein [Flavobacterium branchiarum]